MPSNKNATNIRRTAGNTSRLFDATMASKDQNYLDSFNDFPSEFSAVCLSNPYGEESTSTQDHQILNTRICVKPISTKLVATSDDNYQEVDELVPLPGDSLPSLLQPMDAEEFKNLLEFYHTIEYLIAVAEDSSSITEHQINFGQILNCKFIKGDPNRGTAGVLNFSVPAGDPIYHEKYRKQLSLVTRESSKEPFNSSPPLLMSQYQQSQTVGSVRPGQTKATELPPIDPNSEWNYGAMLSYSVTLGNPKKKYEGEVQGDLVVRLRHLRTEEKLNPSLQVYYSNPPPSEETDRMFWETVSQNIGVEYDEDVARFFNAWASLESTNASNNPFGSSYPGTGRIKDKSGKIVDHNMTSFNWAANKQLHWVKNYSTPQIGAKLLSDHLKKPLYRPILDGIRSKSFLNKSWYFKSDVKHSFHKWGGHSDEYSSKVWSRFKNKRKRKRPINTNRPGGIAGRAIA